MKTINLTVLAFLLLFLPSCTATPKATSSFTPVAVPEGKAVVYIYTTAYGNGIYRIDANGEPLTLVSQEQYFPYVLDPQKLHLSSKVQPQVFNIVASAIEPVDTLDLDLKAGERRYVKMTGTFNLNFIEVPRDTALKELEDFRLVPRYVDKD